MNTFRIVAIVGLLLAASQVYQLAVSTGERVTSERAAMLGSL